jgi:hypothetical protein
VTTKTYRRLVMLGIATVAFGLAGCGTATGPAAPSTTGPSAEVPGAGVSGQAMLDDLPAEPDPGQPDPADPADPADPQPPSPDPQPPTVVEPAAEDCVSYNPSNLTVTASGDAWILRDGSHSMKLFDTQSDAEDGKKVARNWTKLCFIGRGNTRTDRYRYIITYFKSPSGLPLGPAPAFDCISYNPATLSIYSGAAHPADPTQDDWALYSGGTPLLFLASEPDALRAKLVAGANTRLCFIGQGNDRPDPARYAMEYWRA